MDTHAPLLLNPLLVHQDFDDASAAPKTLMELPDRNGRMRRMTLPTALFEFLQQFDGQRSLAEIRQFFIDSEHIQLEWSTFETFLEEQLLPKKILVPKDTDDHHAPEVSSRPDYMSFKQTLFGPRWVNIFVQPLTWLFHSKVAMLLIALSIVAQFTFYFDYQARFQPIFGYNSVDLILGIAISGFGLLFHELGHAAAAYRNGCRKVEVGIGWYIYFFVFFADLSESWRLSRKQRAVIDAGGMYFQTLYITLLIVLLPQYPLPAIYFSLLLLNFSLLWNLNPFLRLDGYWLASDLLGIANLRRAAANTLKQLPSYFKHGTMQVVANTRLQPKTLIYLAVYAVFSNLFFLWLFYLITTQVVFDILQQLPESFGQVMKLQEQDFVFSDWLVTLTRLFWQLLFFYFIVYFIQKSTRRLVTGLWSLIQMRKNKRAATTNSASS